MTQVQPPPLPDPEIEPVISVERAGAYLGLGRSSAYLAVRRGDLPAFRCGRRWLVPTARFRRLLGLDATGCGSRPGAEEGSSAEGAVRVSDHKRTAQKLINDQDVPGE
jgi:excisionase family DNA binding protein